MAHTQNETNSEESDIENKINLQNVLRDNLDGCDILLCLFMAALKSYRVDTCLRPFPPMYSDQFNKDIDTVRRICKCIPPLKSIALDPDICSNELIELLVWLFCQRDQPMLKKVSYNEINVPGEVKKSLHPHSTYLVVYPERADITWKNRKGSRRSFLAYHGSRLENFYSIFKVGLQQHVGGNRIALFGSGIYFSTEITVSMAYSPFAHSWENSIFGNKQSIIALCDIIDDIEKVKYKDSQLMERAVNPGSISGTIPEKYFVVTDSEMARLKYLFVFKSKSVSTMQSWLCNHLAFMLIFMYVIILLSIGFFQGPMGKKIMKQLYLILYLE